MPIVILDPLVPVYGDTALPQINATLLRVEAAGGTGAGESYDGPAAVGDGEMKWQAPAGLQPNAYLREKRLTRDSPEGHDIIMDRMLILPAGDPDVDWRVGDVVRYRTLGAFDETVATVQIVQRATIDDPEIPPELQTARLTLDPV